MSAENEREGNDARATAESDVVVGERGIPSINRSLSLQARISHVLAIGLMVTLGIGLLTWYYTQALSRPARVERESELAGQRKAQGDMVLRPLGRVEAPLPRAPVGEQATFAQSLLGPAPLLPAEEDLPYGRAQVGSSEAHSPAETKLDQALKRRLGGEVLVLAGRDGSGEGSGDTYIRSAAAAGAGSLGSREVGSGSDEPQDVMLGALLRPTVMTATAAAVMPTRRLLLPKGAFLDCTLETAIDSTLPGMTTCVLATDVFGADGTVVLLERGTKLIGETRGRVRNGMSRVFVVWTEARTPTGVVVQLASPGTDALGRAGLDGEVDRHFLERFGAAILISVIDGAIQGAVQSSRSGSTVVLNPSGSQDVLTEVLRQTVDVPPTVRVAHGSRLAVLVARDVDFRSVYRLRAVDAHD